MNWKLDVFYKNEEEFNEDLKLLDEKLPGFSKFKGKLNQLEVFKEYIEFEEEITKILYRLYMYAHLSSDLNLKDQHLQSLNQSVMFRMNQISSLTAYISPELISIGEEKIMEFVNSDDSLKPYLFPMQKLFKQQQYVLSNKEEQVLANFARTRSVPTQLYQALSLTDRIDEEITLSNGEKLVVNTQNWRSLIPKYDSPKDRELIFEAAFKRYKDNKDAFAHVYNLVLQQMAANFKSRGYSSALESRLFGNDIPLDVFMTLKDTVYETNETVRRYVKLRQKHLKLDKYNSYDRFLPLVSKLNKEYSYEEGKELFFKALEGFDEEFVNNQKDALADGYVDVSMKDGKRTGAYSSGVYGYHPFILLNHDKSLDSIFTLVHEAGHSAHTIFANETQPMPISRYTIFVAEIASTFNERVLADYLLKTAQTKEEKINIIEREIDGIMSTFYRQTLFATYEYEANQLVEKGIPLNSSNLSKIMIDLYKHFYDIDITTEPGKEFVWAYIPHMFHTPFYVYQYSSSYAASLKIYEDVKNGKEKAMDNYIEMLKSGGSEYPVIQAKNAGADLTKKETYLAVVKRFNELIDELENLLEN